MSGQFFYRKKKEHRALAAREKFRAYAPRYNVPHILSKWTEFTTWPVPRRRFITNTMRLKPLKPTFWAPFTRWAWPNEPAHGFYRPQPPKSTATRPCIRSGRNIGEMSICIGPRSCYDEGKRVAETLFFDYHRQNGVDIRVIRIFNTYGPRMHPDDGSVVSNFIVQALRGRTYHIRRRIANAFVLLCNRPYRGHDAHDGAGRVYRACQHRQPR